MNKNKPILKALCAASLLAMGMSAQQLHAGERYIVNHDNSTQSKATKKEMRDKRNIRAEGKDWYAAEMDAATLKTMRGKKGVVSIEVDPIRLPLAIYNDTVGSPDVVQVTPYGYFQSQADQVQLQASDVKVCVIDSGIAGSNGETGGRNDDFDWSVITGDNDPGTGNWDADGGPHGTHVAGTVGAEDNSIGVIGMAPGVPMHIIKVFTVAGYTYSSDLAQAANLCAAAGANVINMSLGGGGQSIAERTAFEDFAANGGLVLAAAGNDGNSVRSYPAGYDAVMMVGAVDADNVAASFSQFPSCNSAKTDCVEISAGGVSTLSTVPSGGGSSTSVVADGVAYAASAMENNGSASGDTYNFGLGEVTDNGANGKICIIERGNITFHDKVANCENSGGLGAIIYNNVPGLLNGTLGTTNTTTIPAAGARQEDGAALLASATASIAVGPSNYDYFSGTSMATPTTAGVAALVWSNHPNCTGEEIRAALKTTAQDQGANGHDVNYGAGIVKAKDASDYLATQTCGGTVPPVNEAPTAAFTSDCVDLTCSFDASASSDSDGSIVSYAWSFGATGVTANNTFAASGTYDVTLTVTDDDGDTGSSTQSLTVDDSLPPANVAPTAEFSASCTDLDCSFDASASSDSDGSIVSYAWSFGATGVTANNTFAAAGTYAVTLTVTDDDGASDSTSQNVSVTEPVVSNIDMTLGVNNKGNKVIISWSGVTTSRALIYRDGSLLKRTRNDGSHGDKNVRSGNTYTYKVCNDGSSTDCSAEASITL